LGRFLHSVCKWRLVFIVLLAGLLRLWGLLYGPPTQHVDEFSFIYIPLGFFSGDLNPHFFTYPTLHYYVLWALYGAFFIFQSAFTTGWTLAESALFYYIQEPETLLSMARWAGVAFAVGTVWWNARLGDVTGRNGAGWIAALLLALCVVHIRQSSLAAVDIPMAFWYVGATWAAVGLLTRDQLRDYILAGALVGLAASNKYPGALAGVATAAAHFLAGRRLADSRLWLAGLVAIVTFIAGSPFVLGDFEVFQEHFVRMAGTLQKGRDDLGTGWVYYVQIVLRYSLGWAGGLLTLAAAAMALKERRRPILVIWVAFAVYFIFMGSGRLVFARYSLPLLALQAVLVADFIRRWENKKIQALLLVLVLLQPAYGSLRITQLLGRPDTRLQARQWVEKNIPTGARICNFGGWAGDVPLATVEELGWRIKHYNRSFGQLVSWEEWRRVSERQKLRPRYSYGVQTINRNQERGSLGALEYLQCEYVVLHQHPLSFSRIDRHFSAALADRAQLLMRFDAQGLAQSQPSYDDNDAYYAPLGDFGALGQLGPSIEIWAVQPPYGAGLKPASAKAQLARAFAEAALLTKSPATSRKLVERAFALNTNSAMAFRVLGKIELEAGRSDEALEAFDQASRLAPGYLEPHLQKGLIYAKRGQFEEALRHWRDREQSLLHFADHHFNMGVAHSRLGQWSEAAISWQRTVELEPDRVEVWHRLGQTYVALADTVQARRSFQYIVDHYQRHELAAEAGDALRALLQKL
jgi:tetratricopeptide (TPR) repeat protein